MTTRQNPGLSQWVVEYIKNRDIYLKKILVLNASDTEVVVKYPDRSHHYFIIGDFEHLKECLACIKPKEDYTIVVFNTEANFEVLLKGWDTLSAIKNLYIMFVNPASEAEEKWIIKPYVHARISDASSLKTGLRSMFETVATMK